MAFQFGSTWWGKQWLKAFSNIDWSNRLPRGRSYARNGSVREINTQGTSITGKVQGSRPKPYKVEIKVGRFTESEKQKTLQTVTENPAFLAKLLSRELPPQLKDALTSTGIHIFPRSWQDMAASCSCPDYAVPCKHIAAIIYLVATEIDKNPFLVFQLHGMDLLQQLEEVGIRGAQQALAKVPSAQEMLEQLLPNDPQLETSISLLHDLDFSTLPECRTELLSLLSSNPLFYPDGDFKKILEKKLKKVGQEAGHELAKEVADAPPPDVFPELVTQIELVLNESLRCTAVRLHTLRETIIWEHYKRNPLDRLLKWLSCLQLAQVHRSSPVVQALASVYKLSLILLKQGAIIPQILEIGSEEFSINWQAALLKNEVRLLLDTLEKALPTNILLVNTADKTPIYQFFPAHMQASCLVSLFITVLLHRWQAGDETYDIASQAFFEGDPLRTHKKERREMPSLIYLWIKRYYLTHRAMVPVVKVDEGHSNGFEVDLLFIHTQELLREPVPLRDIFTLENYREQRLALLQDLSVLSEYFPKLNECIASQGTQTVYLNSDEFTEVFMRILPVVRLLGIRVLLPKNLEKLVRPRLSVAIDGEAKGVEKHFLSMDELLKYQWQVALGDERITPQEFLKLVKGLSGIVKLRDQYVYIDPKEMQQLIEKLEKPPVLKGTDLLQIALAGEYNGSRIQLSGQVQTILHELLHTQEIHLPQDLQAELRPYQRRGYEWMYKNSRIGFGSIIADDMGLGKTLQVITTLLKFKEDGYLEKKKALVVVPTTLLTNWQKEVFRFAPALAMHVYHGTTRKPSQNSADIWLTTYGVVRSDADMLAKLRWYVVVIDEAQNIKNPGSAQTKAIKKLKADVQIAMSGTPVENRLSEYWSIMDFTNKGYLGPLKTFQKTVAYPIEVEQDQHQLNRFRKITSPFIMRRLKSDKRIISDLPDKIKINEYCTLTTEQAALYQNVVDEIMKEVESSEGIERSGLIFKLIMALKQVCNHPAQFLKKGTADPAFSGKTQRLLELLNSAYENDEKVLIFTQFQQMGDLLQEMIFNQMHSEALFLHGACSRKQRDEMVELFQNQPSVNTMILSLKAGGTGLNLTAANRVVHYDLWWNPAVEAQATDRAYRIGQRKNVFVHRLLTQGTFEEKINTMLVEKQELASLTVMQGEQWVGELSNRELKQMFRLG